MRIFQIFLKVVFLRNAANWRVSCQSAITQGTFTNLFWEWYKDGTMGMTNDGRHVPTYPNGFILTDKKCHPACDALAHYQATGSCPEECGDGGYCCRSDYDEWTNKCSKELKDVSGGGRHYCLQLPPSVDRPFKGSQKLSDGRTISYVRSTKLMDYIEANSWCTEQNGNLPIPTSQEENDFLADIGSTWLGANAQDLSNFFYTNWVRVPSAEPSGGPVQLIVGDRWNVDWGYGGWNGQGMVLRYDSNFGGYKMKLGDLSTTCYLAIEKATNCAPEGWSDSYDDYNCKLYMDRDLCTITGGYGGRWGTYFWDTAVFSDFARDGYDASHCAECGCEVTPEELSVGVVDECSWSEWQNRDDPTGFGDMETIAGFEIDGLPTDLCLEPNAAQGRNKATQQITTMQNVILGLKGLYCVNDQNDGGCVDYEVRFCCPEKYTTNLKKSWQDAADLCTAEGKILPIPLNGAERNALCALVPLMSYIYVGIIKGAEPNSYKNYLDQSPATYILDSLIPTTDDKKQCMTLNCFPSIALFMDVECTTLHNDFINFCEEPRWSEWGECSDPCTVLGNSTRKRSRFTGPSKSEEESETCTTKYCVTTECRSWGDPHVTTFDGANNDVFGVTTYVLAQSKSTDQSVRKFRVRLVTDDYGEVSISEKALLDFYDNTGTRVATVEFDSSGNANLFTLDSLNQWISEPLTESKNEPDYSFTFTNNDNLLTVVTDFQVQVMQTNINIYVRIPKEIYADKVEGLCGDNDDDKRNDYQKPDGEVLPYHTDSWNNGINRLSDSEYECAISWIVTDATNGRKKRSISNPEGPHPASVSCTDETIIAECDNLLEPSWLSICEPLVSADRRAELVRICKIDYCMLKEAKTKLDIILQYVIECQEQSEEIILCDWEVQATGKQPVCKANEEYKGCATMCDLPSCNDYLRNNSCNFKANTFSACVCKKDFYLLNGVCVAPEACSASGWSDWNQWSSCSNPCGGSRRRLQICQGSDCTASSQFQEEACSGDCNPCVEAPCDIDATCENNNGAAVCECNDGFDGDGTTCQATDLVENCTQDKVMIKTALAVDGLKNLVDSFGNEVMVKSLRKKWNKVITFSFAKRNGERHGCAVSMNAPVPMSVVPSCAISGYADVALEQAMPDFCQLFERYVNWGIGQCEQKHARRMKKVMSMCTIAQRMIAKTIEKRNKQ